MLIRLEQTHLPMMVEYIKIHKKETIYLVKPVEEMSLGNLQGTFYGYLESDALKGLFYFSNKSVLALHCDDPKILGNLQLLKAIKHFKPKFVKGSQMSTDGIYKLMCRAVQSITENKSTLMIYENNDIQTKIIDGFEVITGKNNRIDDLLTDLRFFIEVETHFGRQVKAINDIAKIFRHLIHQGNYYLIVKEQQIVAQGLIEDETQNMGILSGIYVNAQHRQKGLGHWITGELTKELIRRGKTPYLLVKNNNPNARKLYEKMGYQQVAGYSMLTIHY